MVSFSCESCGDVLTKKKLDAHRNQCRSASFTCLDCMRHFQGIDYRSHTSCISEAQKYQGHLYQSEKEKKSKSKPPTTDSGVGSIHNSRRAYVEDVPDTEAGSIAIVDPPPPAPSPPAAAAPRPAEAQVNVFDFLVNEQTPNASTTDLAQAQPMKMVNDAPAVFEARQQLQNMAGSNASKETFGESRYEEEGFHYGAGPVPAMKTEEQAFTTPAAAVRGRESSKRDHKKDKKRKRLHVDDLDLSLARPGATDRDEVMTDAPPILHSGLTGGLNRLLSRPSEYPPSPEYSTGDGGEPSPSSPIKRSKQLLRGDQSHTSHGPRITALIPTKRTSSTVRNADGTRLRSRSKHHHQHHHKRRHHHDDDDDHHHRLAPQRKRKAIDYSDHDPSQQSHSQNQMIVYRPRAEHFSSLVTKGPESEKGCSVNKVLKRYHRERDGVGVGLGRQEDEKELWKSLRLRKNDRGEMVLFF
ncbi:MAG: hypothetical protein M1837_007145 [Sclerophora amabilis]|nr:MAG: hypothetical protein M1837_007145 [Sclerophora amabilis]